uniref:Uncharacterized protein n=1 Tax=Arion vulgaris TaxID=1028688 RepID=A0A0B7AK18_9EUPU
MVDIYETAYQLNSVCSTANPRLEPDREQCRRVIHLLSMNKQSIRYYVSLFL